MSTLIKHAGVWKEPGMIYVKDQGVWKEVGGGSLPDFGERIFLGPSSVSESYNWVVPDGVYSVSVVCIGPGGAGRYGTNGTGGQAGGGGGALAYANDVKVTPGQSILITVGGNPSSGSRVPSSFGDVVIAGNGGNGGTTGGVGGLVIAGEGGGNGGNGGDGSSYTVNGSGGGGGGAGGYSGPGGDGGTQIGSGSYIHPTNGQGGGGAGGTGRSGSSSDPGGATFVFGEGESGIVGESSVRSGSRIDFLLSLSETFSGGGGGKGGSTQQNADRRGQPGIVRVVWPGDIRKFPGDFVGMYAIPEGVV